MANKKRGTGLDELFSKVFDEPETKNAINSLHSSFGQEETTPQEISLDAKDVNLSPDFPAKEPSALISSQQEEVKDITKSRHRTDPGIVVRMAPGIDTAQDVRTNGGTSGRFAGRPDVDTGHKTDPVTGPGLHAVTRPGIGHGTNTLHISPRQRINNPIWSLSRQQAKVLWYLIQAGGLTQREEIATNTGVPFGTVKNVLSGLHKDGFISKPKPYTDRAFRGFSYEINRHLCEEFMAERGATVFSEDTTDTGTHPVTRPGIHPTVSPSYGPVTHHNINPGGHPEKFPNSSSLESITTSRENYNLEHSLKTDHDLEWWREKGLTVKQVESWMETGNCTVANIIQSLKHFAYEMSELGREERMEKDPSNYFYTVIKKAGYYKAPKGYKSFQEKQVEFEQQLLEQQAQELQKLKEIRQKRYEQEEELAFLQMMESGEGELYQNCFSMLTEFEKELKGIIFEKAMMAKFREIREGGKV